MKKYQVIMPVALPIALAISFFYMVQGRVETNTAYQGHIQAAQAYAQNGVINDALTEYTAAIAINPRIETYLAVGQLYMDQQEYRTAQQWYERKLLETYPADARTYEFGITAQLAQDNTREAYSIYDSYQSRGLQSKAVEALMQPIWYSFDLLGGYAEVGAFGNSNVIAPVKESETWSYINVEGSRAVDGVYQQAGAAGELTPVVDAEGEAYYIDAAGNKKLTASYFLAQDAEMGTITAFKPAASNLALATNGEIWNYYNVETYQKVFGGYKDATLITNGVGAVSQDGNTWALIAADGQTLTGYEYQQILSDEKGVICRGDAVIAEKDGVYRLLDTAGGAIGQTGYEDARAFCDTGMAAVKKDGRWIFVSMSGEEKDMGDFEELQSFSCGIAAARQNGKWGYINENSEWVIEPQFEEAKAFCSAGVAFVKTTEDTWKLLSLYRYHHS